MEHSYTEDCQQLLKLSPSCSGWLRTKNVVHKCGEAVGKNIPKLSQMPNKIVKIIPWDKHFVILFDKVIYVFKDETARKPERRIRLTNFQGVEAMTSDVKEIPWPLKLIKKDGQEEVFAATSQDEQQKWLKAFQDYLDKINDSDDDDSDVDYEEPIENPIPTNTRKSKFANGPSPRGPLPAIPAIGGADICEPPPGEYDNPEDDNSSGSQNNSRLNNINVNNRNEKAHKKPSDGNSGFAKMPGQFVPVLPFGTQDKFLKKPPPPCPSVDPVQPDKSSWKCPPLLPQKDALPNMTKKAPPMPATPKPTVKISPQPQKSVVVENIEVYAGDQLPYELDNLTTKAMWSGSPEEATSIMSKLSQHEGAFLLRVASQGSGYTLHVVKAKKFSIKEENGEFALGGKTFKSIEDLLIHFKDNGLPSKGSDDLRLGKPYSELC